MREREEKKYCQVKMHDRKACSWEVWDKEELKCFFHSSKFELKEKDFSREFDNRLNFFSAGPDLKVCDFTEFVFPKLSFSGKAFSKPAIFRGAKFRGNTHFEKVDFKGADFHESEFSGQTKFSEVKFEGRAIFSRAQFSGDVTFRNSTFENGVDFLLSKFHGAAHFESVEFKGRNSFHGTKFKTASFYESSFYGNTAFSGWISGRPVGGQYVEFQEFVSFVWTRIYGRVLFLGNDMNKVFLSESQFHNLVLGQNGEIVFEKVGLSGATFPDTNLECLTFNDVQWFSNKSRKRALWEEFQPLKPGTTERNFEKIAVNYGQLVKNYEGKRDYPVAEDFHVGEMETRRKRKGAGTKSPLLRKLKEYINVYNLYRLLSNYGTSYWRAFEVLLIMTMGFSLIFLWIGFQSSKESVTSTVIPTEYDWFPDSGHSLVGFGEWFNDYKQALLYTLSIITFQRERFFQPTNGWWSHFWLFVSVIVLTSQVALVLLAVRRRFKR